MSTRNIISIVVLALILVAAPMTAAAQADPVSKPIPEVTHNTWTSGAALPTARMGAGAGAIGKYIYVVDGYNNSAVFGVNEIYSPKKNTWTTGAGDPNPRAFVASAVVNKILYVFGGSNFSELLSLTES